MFIFVTRSVCFWRVQFFDVFHGNYTECSSILFGQIFPILLFDYEVNNQTGKFEQFRLIFMSAAQENFFKKNKKDCIVSVDSTHSTNGHGFYLATLMLTVKG